LAKIISANVEKAFS